jgi:hypothetical protein
MNMTCAFRSFSKGDGYTLSSLGLKKNGSMMFILPGEGVAVTDLLSSPQKLEEILRRAKTKVEGSSGAFPSLSAAPASI